MQAIQLDAVHQPVVLRDVPTPTPGPGEILVKLHAAALNHRDVWIQQGQYAGIALPCTLGATAPARWPPGDPMCPRGPPPWAAAWSFTRACAGA
ncbi:alcohol dehydrogenase catalytic domain-containing protein, partial [Hymenobacter coccineus]|uniref:alcohol dehydrogenase catalytic domain-containing protein n=1 Tax=Hymenobacter coccineus TaxID=1908235 RepID=UPI000B1F6727